MLTFVNVNCIPMVCVVAKFYNNETQSVSIHASYAYNSRPLGQFTNATAFNSLFFAFRKNKRLFCVLNTYAKETKSLLFFSAVPLRLTEFSAHSRLKKTNLYHGRNPSESNKRFSRRSLGGSGMSYLLQSVSAHSNRRLSENTGTRPSSSLPLNI